jgi:hypothetical protein
LAYIYTAHHGEKQGLGTTIGDDKIGGVYFYAEPVIVLGEFLAIAGNTIAGAIFQHFHIQMGELVPKGFRGLKVRLSYIEMVNFRTAFFCAIGIWD